MRRITSVLVALVLLTMGWTCLAESYTGAAQGFGGEISVTVTVENGALTGVTAVGDKETAGIGSNAIEQLPAKMMEAGTWDVDVVSGCTFSSQGVIEAAKAAFAAANLTAAEEDAAPADTAKTHDDEQCDVVIVGGGGSGITAALTAQDAGLKVILVEKMSFLGGNTILATTQMWGAGSRLQKEAGQTETAEDFYNFIMTGKGAKMGLDPDATMLICQRSGEMVDWLLDIGVQFGRVFNTYSHGPADGGAPGPVLMAGLSAKLDSSDVDYRLNTRATSVLMDGERAVGVTVESPEGNYAIYADSVVLATGGFANNSEMVTRFDPRWPNLGCNSSASQTGDGIIMAEAVGAQLKDMDRITINPTVLYNGDQLLSLTALRSNGAILVNNAGQRFANEEGAYTDQALLLLEQDQEDAYMIFDHTMIENVGLIAKYDEQGYFVQADTIEELAGELGIDAQGLTQTIDTYKTYIQGGTDLAFGRSFMTIGFDNAPFYGVKVYPSVQTTSGGIVVNLNAEVISVNDAVIPGLFACGATTCDGTRAVSPLTETFVFGRIAGESATAFAQAN